MSNSDLILKLVEMLLELEREKHKSSSNVQNERKLD